MNFGKALEIIKHGGKAERAGWNGKGMWICLGEGHAALGAEHFWNEHTQAFAQANGGSATVLPYIVMKTAGGEILMGWLASQSDILAEDWRPTVDSPVANVTEPESEREQLLEGLLRSACAIADRQGAGTAWERFAASVHAVGLNGITARTYRVLPSDQQ